MVELVRTPGSTTTVPVLDAVQRAAVEDPSASRLVLGAPGTGKSVVAVEAVVHAHAGGLPADSCVILAPTRLQAAALREVAAARLTTSSSAPMARTPQALGFGILRRLATLAGREAPRLLTGPEQDVILAELLAGHARGDAPAPNWPDFLREALPTKGFRHELRDLLMRAVEWGIDAEQLRALGQEHERTAWLAAAEVLDEYDQVTALSRPGAYDPAWIMSGAADLLETEPEQLAQLHDELRLIVVDDAQELTRAAVRLIGLLVGPNTRLVLIGDPDAAVQTFRGADPSLFGALAARSGEPARFVLSRSYRLPSAIAVAAGRVTDRIGAVAGVDHRRPETLRQGSAEVALFKAVSQESAHIAAELRRAHFERGVPWSQMAVLTRGQSRLTGLRRVLQVAGVPVAVPPTVLALRDEPAVRPLLAVFEVARDIAAGQLPSWTADELCDVLTSPLAQADSLTIRRLRRALRAMELADGGGRTADEMMTDSIHRPDVLVTLGPIANPMLLVSRMIAAAVAAWDEPGADAEQVLWAMWSAAGIADGWAKVAVAGGQAGTRADHDLDAVVALFSAAQAYVDRLEGVSPAGFLDHIREQEVPGDRMTSAAPAREAVDLLTTAAAAGRQWQFVVVAGVQEGVWPDLRLRGSLLGSEALVDALTGRPDDLRAQAAAVRYDETRQFHVALTRASERVLVTAVRSDEEQPSVYLDLVDPLDRPRPFTGVGRSLTLRAMVAELRRELVPGGGVLPPDRAASLLAELDDLAVPGADPDSWWAFHDLSSLNPVRRPDQQVTVSPSKVSDFAQCGLRWFLSSRGGQGPDIGAASLGTLVHEIAAEFGDDDPDRMIPALHERWGQLGLGDTWIGRQKKELAIGMLERVRSYIAAAADEGWTKVQVEIAFDVTEDRLRLKGRVDRLERHDDHGLRIIDLKTGSSKPSRKELEEHPQLAAYQWAVESQAFPDHGDTSGGAALLQVGKAASSGVDLQRQAPLAKTVDPQWAGELLQATAEGMGGADFTATPGPQCQICPVRRACPAAAEGAAS
ncbi:ATP-dependent helicase [Calidifontibacter terrae]